MYIHIDKLTEKKLQGIYFFYMKTRALQYVTGKIKSEKIVSNNFETIGQLNKTEAMLKKSLNDAHQRTCSVPSSTFCKDSIPYSI